MEKSGQSLVFLFCSSAFYHLGQEANTLVNVHPVTYTLQMLSAPYIRTIFKHPNMSLGQALFITVS